MFVSLSCAQNTLRSWRCLKTPWWWLVVVTLPPEMSRIDTRSQHRMQRFSICRSKILIFGFHQNRVYRHYSVRNITLNGQLWCFITVSGIFSCNCCNTVVCETNFLSSISQNGTLYGRQIDFISHRQVWYSPVCSGVCVCVCVCVCVGVCACRCVCV